MAKYLSALEIQQQMELAQRVLSDAAKAAGMTIGSSVGAIRIHDLDGTLILSLYAPAYGHSNRFWVDGKFAPYVHRVVGRPRFLSKNSFGRGDAVAAAREAVQCVRRQTDMERLLKDRDRALALRGQSHPYRGPDENDIPREYGGRNWAEIVAMEAYAQGFRSSDPVANQQTERAVRIAERLVSDSVWYDLLWASWNVDIQRATV